MKTIILKSVAVILISFAFIQSSDACGRYFYRACAPRVYYGPRYVPAHYVRAFVPGHFVIGRFGERVWIPGHYC